MRALLSLLIVLAALAPASAAQSESLAQPNLKLTQAIGWKLTAEIRMDVEDGVRFLNIEGKVTNSSQSERPSPKIRVDVLASEGKGLFYFTVRPDEARIKPGAFSVFGARLDEPPLEMATVEIRTIEGE